MGLTVLAIGRNDAALAELARECGAVPLQADVRDSRAIADQLAGREVDILANNGGLLSRTSFQEIEPNEIDAMIDVNLKAPMHLTRIVLPGMVERKRGHLIYIGSSAG